MTAGWTSHRHLRPAPLERLLLVGEMFRPEWQVAEQAHRSSHCSERVVCAYPQAHARPLRYYPPVRAALTCAAWTTMIVVGLVLIAASARRAITHRATRHCGRPAPPATSRSTASAMRSPAE